jgi:transposase-like protein
MPRRCTVCDHTARADVDRALVRGAALRDVAGQYGLSKSAVERHQKEHLPRVLTDAAAEEERTTAAALLADLRRYVARAEGILERADGKDDALALKALAELRQLVTVALKGVETTELEERLDSLEKTLTPKRTA